MKAIVINALDLVLFDNLVESFTEDNGCLLIQKKPEKSGQIIILIGPLKDNVVEKQQGSTFESFISYIQNRIDFVII